MKPNHAEDDTAEKSATVPPTPLGMNAATAVPTGAKPHGGGPRSPAIDTSSSANSITAVS